MVLPSFVKLKTLNLRDNHIADAGAEALATALPSLGSLRGLDLRNNRISDAKKAEMRTAFPDIDFGFQYE